MPRREKLWSTETKENRTLHRDEEHTRYRNAPESERERTSEREPVSGKDGKRQRRRVGDSRSSRLKRLGRLARWSGASWAGGDARRWVSCLTLDSCDLTAARVALNYRPCLVVLSQCPTIKRLNIDLFAVIINNNNNINKIDGTYWHRRRQQSFVYNINK